MKREMRHLLKKKRINRKRVKGCLSKESRRRKRKRKGKGMKREGRLRVMKLKTRRVGMKRKRCIFRLEESYLSGAIEEPRCNI